MRIAICDDEHEICALLCNYVESYMKSNNMIFDLECFNSAEDLLSEIKSSNSRPFDLYFLDIYMGDMNGIQLAEAIRTVDIYAHIVFITGSEEHRQTAFEVQAFYYMVKPFTQEQFDQCLRRSLRIKADRAKISVFNSDIEVTDIPLDHILYIESLHSQTIFHTNEESYHTYQSLSELESILPGNLYRCHKSYIINMKQIYKRYSDKCILYNGSEIPIGRKYSNQFKKDYLAQLRRKAN